MIQRAVRKSPIPESRAFVIRDLHEKFFDPNWHFHAEYQLFVVLEGRGTRFIGDSIHPYKEGDMVLTGPYIPHLWRCEDAYYERNNDLKTRGVVIYFPEDFMGGALTGKEELSAIRQLFQKAARGVAYKGATRDTVTRLMLELLSMHGTGSIVRLLEILDLLAHSRQYEYLNPDGYTNVFKESEAARMTRVYEYVISRFRQEISLKEVAALTCMTPSSFSRYFRTRANKSFSGFISELRIGYACKLLQESDHTIAQICYASGYPTLSNFNKQFRTLTGQSPSAYRKEYSELNQ
ncbi:AraC family transcriptional regulator [Compostibacter hankyongensis]|uniref:AraC family transcriptional regulator n=1 Tax=Compostibacter hankyongensis TaxID=1007089 RepID=A0ABP8FZC9_9BACT